MTDRIHDEGDHATSSRREFLGGLAAATAGVAFVGVGIPRSAVAATPATGIEGTQYMPIGNGAYELYRMVDGRKLVYARLARDGCLPGSIYGTYVGSSGQTFTVAVPKIGGTVDVQLAPDTEVDAGGERRIADLSLVNIGDDLSVGTELIGDGQRVAEYVRANVQIGFVQVTSADQESFSGIPLNRLLNPIPEASEVTFTLGHPFGDMPATPPAVGEYWHYFATAPTPDRPQQRWVHTMMKVGDQVAVGG